MDVRAAEASEIDTLARIWYDGWQDAHAELLPKELTPIRTLKSFRDRLSAALADVRVVGPIGEPAGFCLIKGDELYQLYVSAPALAPAPQWRCEYASARGRAVREAADRAGRLPAGRGLPFGPRLTAAQKTCLSDR